MTKQLSVPKQYASSEFARSDFLDKICTFIETHSITRVCEVGGGANPLLDLTYIQARNIEYTIIDVSEEELQKAPNGYNKVVLDISSPEKLPAASYQLVFSRMLAEHIDNARQFHMNIFNLLAPGGRAIHLFPTLFALPFVLNKLLPETLSLSLIRFLQPQRDIDGLAGKFVAYYHWCFGPTEKQLDRFAQLGYQVIDVSAYFGHPYYYRRIPFVRSLHSMLSSLLIRHPVNYLTSYCTYTLGRR